MIGCYIIYSKSLNRFYTGALQKDLVERIKKHNEHFYGANHFTAKASDWELFIFIECDSYPQAIKIEQHIKRMKSVTFIRNLQKYPELVEKLKLKYSNP